MVQAPGISRKVNGEKGGGLGECVECSWDRALAWVTDGLCCAAKCVERMPGEASVVCK